MEERESSNDDILEFQNLKGKKNLLLLFEILCPACSNDNDRATVKSSSLDPQKAVVRGFVHLQESGPYTGVEI